MKPEVYDNGYGQNSEKNGKGLVIFKNGSIYFEDLIDHDDIGNQNQNGHSNKSLNRDHHPPQPPLPVAHLPVFSNKCDISTCVQAIH